MDSKQYFLGVSYSRTEFHYSVYLTDFNYVWVCNVDNAAMSFKATQLGYEGDTETLSALYRRLAVSFDSSFSGSETAVEVEELKLDRGVPLELKLTLVRQYEGHAFQWTFDLGVLRDSSAITIMKNVLFYQSTIIMSLNEYKDDLVKLLQQKDTAIRYLTEIVNGMNGQEMIHKWAPENSLNRRNINTFDPAQFDGLWKEKKLPRIQDEYIWDILDKNCENGTWEYGTTFREAPVGDRKRAIEDNKDPQKRRRIGDVEGLSREIKDCNLKKPDEVSQTPSPQKRASSPSKGKREPSHTADQTPKSPTRQTSNGPSKGKLDSKDQMQSPTKHRQTFGGPRKRTISQRTLSPIKAAKHRHSP